jgi:glycosyltransferase involved in cell wall biosynthesis
MHLSAGNLYGGVESVLVSLGRYSHFSPRLQHEFILLHRGRFSEELAAEGQVFHVIPPARLSRPWTVWRSRRALARLLEDRPAPVVVSHQLWPLLVYGPVIGAKRRVVLYIHGPSSGGGWLEWCACRRRTDRIIAVSRHALETFRGKFPAVPAEVIHNPMPWPESAFYLSAPERLAVRAELGTPSDAVVILQASRMEPWKGQDVHLSALARLKDDPSWVCWIAGGAQRPEEAHYLESLRRQAAEAGLEGRVHFLGERRDVRRLMAAADVYCQGNRGPEGFSIAFLEAFSAGLPIVTSALGGALEMIDDTCGMLVPPESPEQLADCLGALIADPGRRIELGRGARKRASALSDPCRQMAAVQAAMLATAGTP